MLVQLDLLYDTASAQVSDRGEAVATAAEQLNPNEQLNSKHFRPYHSASASELRLSKIAGGNSCLSMLLNSLVGFRLYN